VKVTVRQDPRISFEDQTDENNMESTENNESEDEDDGDYSFKHLPLNRTELSKLHKYPLILRRITQQTGKGRIHRMASLVVVGNGNGLVGYGQGKGESAIRAMDKGYAKAVRNMDYVNRFEQRTVWTEMDTKLGGTHVYLRPRPLGFGLRCNPNIHQIMKAAGIRDISAKVWGSRNPLNVIQATFRMLQAGSAPLGMGDGLGGPGRTLSKGSGARSKDEIERERGRKMFQRSTY
jgi:small subunit ribosomal protein S5